MSGADATAALLGDLVWFGGHPWAVGGLGLVLAVVVGLIRWWDVRHPVEPSK